MIEVRCLFVDNHLVSRFLKWSFCVGWNSKCIQNYSIHEIFSPETRRFTTIVRFSHCFSPRKQRIYNYLSSNRWKLLYLIYSAYIWARKKNRNAYKRAGITQQSRDTSKGQQSPPYGVMRLDVCCESLLQEHNHFSMQRNKKIWNSTQAESYT